MTHVISPGVSDSASAANLPLRRQLGPTGPKVFPLAIGGNAFGWTAAEDAACAILDEYVGRGGNIIDTADSHARGASETIVGNWMRSRRNRSELVVSSRIGRDDQAAGVSARAISAAIDASIARLGTDRLDVVFLDVNDETTSLEEALVALDEQVRRGTVLHVGLANHSSNRLIEARVIAAQLGLSPLIAVQTRYSLTHRTEFEGAVATVAAQQQLGVMARFALDGGFLAGNYRDKTGLNLNTTGNIVLGGDAQSHMNRRGQRILTTLDRVAQEQGCEPATIAIAWLLCKPNVVAPVVGASTPAQVAALMDAAHIVLTRQQVAALDDVSD